MILYDQLAKVRARGIIRRGLKGRKRKLFPKVAQSSDGGKRFNALRWVGSNFVIVRVGRRVFNQQAG